MSALPLERWAREAVEREQHLNWEPVETRKLLQEIADFKRLQLLKWQERQRRIAAGETLRLTSARGRAGLLGPRALRMAGATIAPMPESTFAGLLAYPNAQTVTTTTISGTVNLWSNLVYSPIPINSVLAPQVFRVAVVAKITTVATPANIGFNPLINSAGTWTTGGTAVSGGSTLGASTNVALTASITNAFYYIVGDLMIRAPGTVASILAMFHYVSTQNTAAGLAGPAATSAAHNLLFGGTTVTPDTQTTAQSFQLGAVHTVTTITHNVEQLHYMDWN